jgi:hypothetical protein
VAILTACRDREKLATVVKLKPDLILTKPVDFIRLLTFITDVRAGLGLTPAAGPVQSDPTVTTPPEAPAAAA